MTSPMESSQKTSHESLVELYLAMSLRSKIAEKVLFLNSHYNITDYEYIKIRSFESRKAMEELKNEYPIS